MKRHNGKPSHFMFMNQKIHQIHLKDYDELMRVLQNHDYHKALTIDLGNQNKHDKLAEVLQHQVVQQWIDQNW